MRRLVLIAGALLLATGACSSDGDAATTTTTATTVPGEPPTTPMRLVATADGFTLDVTEVEPGWITLTVRNETDDPLDATVLRIRDEGTTDDVATDIEADGVLGLAEAPDGDGDVPAGGVSMVPPSGERTFRTEVFEGPHLVGSLSQLIQGDATSLATFDVEAGTPPLNDPETEGRVLIQDYSFVFDEAMRNPGQKLVTIATDGPSLHELRLYRVREGIEPGVALEALKRLPEAPDVANDEVEPVVGIGPVATPLRNITEVDLEEGAYIVACFLPDPATGTPHAGLGMITQLLVAAA